MRNHVLCIAFCSRDYDKDPDFETDYSTLNGLNLCEAAVGSNSDHWGARWGTYETEYHELGGDGLPVLIEFQCAWNPPSPEAMRDIENYLKEAYCLKDIRWLFHEPYDNTIAPIEVAGKEQKNNE